MFNNISEIFSQLKNAGPMMEQMKGQMAEAQERVKRLRVSGEAGAGMVRVTASGDGHIVDCKFDTSMITAEDLPMLEDLVISAVNDALAKSREASAYEMKKAMPMGEHMPDFMKNLFNQNNPPS